MFVFKEMSVAIINPFLCTIYIALGVSFALNKKFGYSLGLGYLMLILSGFIGGLFYNICLGFCLYLILIFLIYLIKIKQLGFKCFLDKVKEQLFSNSFLVFCLIYIIVLVMDWQRGLSFYDEFMHWAFMAKETYRLNQFHIVDASQMWFHKDYPGFIALFQSFWCFISGSFEEAYCYRALHILGFALFLPLFDKNLNFKRAFLLGALIFILPLTIQVSASSSDNALFYNSIYLDWLIGIVSGVTVYYCLFEKDASFDILICFQMTLVLMSKQIGIYFFAICALLFVYRLIKKHRIKFIFYLLIPIFVFACWKYIVVIFNEQGQFAAEHLNLTTLINIFVKGQGEEYQLICIKNFFNALVYDKKFEFPFAMPYYLFLFFQLLLMFIFIRINKFNEAKIVPLLYFIGGLIYSFAILVLYLFTFTEFEATSLASLNRYLQTYTICGNTFIFLIVFEAILNMNKFLYKVIVCILLGSFVDLNSLEFSKPAIHYNGANDAEFAALLNVIDSKDDDESMMIVAQYLNLEYPMIRYYAPEKNARITTFGPGNLNAARVDIASDEFIDYLGNYDLIYTYSVDDYFLSNYWNLIDAEYLDQRLYRVCHPTNNLILIDHINTIENTRQRCAFN